MLLLHCRLPLTDNPPDPKMLHVNVKNVLSEYLAAGLDPDVATIYVQSDVPEVAELSLLLSMHAYVGELERTTSFKDKIRKQPNNVNIGLLSYPVLMAADILQHRATRVPVGKDQEQHLELTRRFARRFNQLYQVDFFPECQPYTFGGELIKFPDWTDRKDGQIGGKRHLPERQRCGHPQKSDESRNRFGTDRTRQPHAGGYRQPFHHPESRLDRGYRSSLHRSLEPL